MLVVDVVVVVVLVVVAVSSGAGAVSCAEASPAVVAMVAAREAIAIIHLRRAGAWRAASVLRLNFVAPSFSGLRG